MPHTFPKNIDSKSDHGHFTILPAKFSAFGEIHQLTSPCNCEYYVVLFSHEIIQPYLIEYITVGKF